MNPDLCFAAFNIENPDSEIRVAEEEPLRVRQWQREEYRTGAQTNIRGWPIRVFQWLALIGGQSPKSTYLSRYFPLERIHLNAMHFAQISECAHEQRKFWPMHDWLLTRQQVIDGSDDLKGAGQRTHAGSILR
jgi:hypothetical protein